MAMVGVLWHFAIKAVVSCNQGCSICNAAFTRISTAALIKFFTPQMRCLFEGGAFSSKYGNRPSTQFVFAFLKEKHTCEKSAKMLL